MKRYPVRGKGQDKISLWLGLVRLSIYPLCENAGSLGAHACACKQTHKQYSGLGLAGKGWNEADGCPFYCYVTLLRTNLHAFSGHAHPESHLLKHIVVWFLMFYAFFSRK